MKCINCGAECELTKSLLKWRCPFCDSLYDAEGEDAEKIREKYQEFDPEMFVVERDFSEFMDKKVTATNIKSLKRCLNELGSVEEILSYIRRTHSNCEDIAMDDIREDMINACHERLASILEPSEKLLMYIDRGIFFKNKEYYLITDKRSIFVYKKKNPFVYHKDISSLKLESFMDTPSWEINQSYETAVGNVAITGDLSGAIVALIILLGFRNDPNKDRIRLI
ncbi:MAG: hypothetical protein K5656_03770 [Lachnospiraceae bacterium]|nr:hypothetical protein [Lachnospiraceae bacterium]